MINRRRVQKSFKNKKEAIEWSRQKAIEIRNNLTGAFSLSDAHRRDALEAIEKLSGKLNIPASDLPNSSVSLSKAVDFYVKRCFPEGGKRTVADLAGEYLRSKASANLRPATIRDLEFQTGRLVNKLGGVFVHLVTREDLERMIDDYGYTGITRRNFITNLGMLFKFARTRKLITENPADDIVRPSLNEKIPQSLSVDECEKLMRSVEKHAPNMIPFFAVSLFAGLRRAEVMQLDWSNINFNARRIKVTPETAKRRRLRHVDMSDNLAKWLASFRNDTGRLYYLRDDFDNARKKAGITWTNNVLRHSFASYHLAMYENAAQTSLQLGHRDTEVLFNHYRDLVTREDAQRFWKLVPRQEETAV